MAQLFTPLDATSLWSVVRESPVPVSAGPDASPRWQRIPLDAGALALPGGDGSTRLLRITEGRGPARWIVVQPASGVATRNGVRMGLCVAVVEHGDCLRAQPGAAPLWFSSEARPRVETCSGPPGASCARCRQPLRHDRPAVRCPRCDVWHHEDGSEQACWTYASRCARCEQPTSLGGALRWLPGRPLDG